MKETFSSRLLLMALMLSLVISITHDCNNTTATKLVREKANTFIDLTNKDRQCSNASKVGFGPNMLADAYMLDELVTLYAWVVYNNNPMQHRLVSFEVNCPCGLFLCEQNRTIFDLVVIATNYRYGGRAQAREPKA